MLSSIITGNAAQVAASPTAGWVVGHFMPEGIGNSQAFEIKIWHYDNQPRYGQKLFNGTEFIIAESGSIRLELEVPDGQGGFVPREIELSGATRDYVVLPPGCKKRVVVTKAPTFGITVRWPSAPGTNVVVQ